MVPEGNLLLLRLGLQSVCGAQICVFPKQINETHFHLTSYTLSTCAYILLKGWQSESFKCVGGYLFQPQMRSDVANFLRLLVFDFVPQVIQNSLF